jgi:hypothetical protein
MGCDVRNGYDCPLRWSAAAGHLNIVKKCVQAGAETNTYNNEAIRKAEEYGHTPVVDYLREIMIKKAF